MKSIDRVVQDYRYLVDERFSQYAGPILIVSALIAVVLSHRLVYRKASAKTQRRVTILLGILTVVSLVVAAYEFWYWGDITYESTVNVVPILLMDTVATVTFIHQPKGIAAFVLFVVFLLASLVFVSNTIFGELFPINRIVGSGLLAD